MFATAVIVNAATLLLLSGIEHLRNPSVLPQAVASHQVLPRRVQQTVARTLPAVEAATGAVLLVGLLAPNFQRATVGFSALLFTSFTVYLGIVFRAQDTFADRAGSCGCLPGDTGGLGGYQVARAGALAVAACAAAVAGPEPSSAEQGVVGVMMGLTVAGLVVIHASLRGRVRPNAPWTEWAASTWGGR